MYEARDTIRHEGATGTLWRGRDAEGRAVYVVTTDRDGISKEPTHAYLTTTAAAIQNWKEDVDRNRRK